MPNCAKQAFFLLKQRLKMEKITKIEYNYFELIVVVFTLIRNMKDGVHANEYKRA